MKPFLHLAGLTAATLCLTGSQTWAQGGQAETPEETTSTTEATDDGAAGDAAQSGDEGSAADTALDGAGEESGDADIGDEAGELDEGDSMPLIPAASNVERYRLGELTKKLFRGRHPLPLDEGEFQLTVTGVNTEEDIFGFDGYVGLEYGVLDHTTIGIAIGGHPTSAATSDSFFQSVFANPAATVDSSDDVNISAAHTFVKSKDTAVTARLDIVFTPDFPTANAARPATYVEYRPSVQYGSRVDEDLEVYGGVGLALADESGETERLLIDMAGATPISDVVVGLFEFDVVVGDESFFEAYVTPGIVFNARSHVQVQIGTPIGLTSDSADYQILTSVLVDF